jgi:glycosyltransferase involved in cell wall biosynthesis
MTISFSAIIPNYNDSAALPTALDSLLAQTSPFTEIIIIDDASTDGGKSRAIIEGYVAKYGDLFTFIQNEKNQGVIGSLNVGMDAARGDYVIMCSANDWYAEREVEICRAMLEKYPGTTMVCGNAATWEADKNKAGESLILTFPQVEKRYTPADYVAHAKCATAYFNGGAIAMKRSRILEFGKQYPELKWHADLMLYLLFAYTDDFVFVPEIFSTVRLEATKSFSHGRFDWSQQKQVTGDMIRMFKNRYPEQGKLARESAMLPAYNFRTLELLLTPDCRWYASKLLLWRILFHSLFYWTRHYIPRRFIDSIRHYFRV